MVSALALTWATACGGLEDLRPERGRISEVETVMSRKDTIGRPSSRTTDSGGRYSSYFGPGSRDAPDRMRICRENLICPTHACVSRTDSLRKRTGDPTLRDWARRSILVPVDKQRRVIATERLRSLKIVTQSPHRTHELQTPLHRSLRIRVKSRQLNVRGERDRRSRLRQKGWIGGKSIGPRSFNEKWRHRAQCMELRNSSGGGSGYEEERLQRQVFERGMTERLIGWLDECSQNHRQIPFREQSTCRRMKRSVAENPPGYQGMSSHWDPLNPIRTITESGNVGQNSVMLQPSPLEVLEVA